MFALTLFATGLVQGQQWNKDLNAALAKSGQQDKLVFLLFSLPDACDICDKFEKNVIGSEQFKRFAEANYILARPDFRESASFETKADNLLIVEKYNKDGFFPWVVILDSSGKILGKIGLYKDESPEVYIGKLQSAVKR